MRAFSIIIVTAFSLVGLQRPAFAADSDPAGFRGIPWGAPISQFADQLIEFEDDGDFIMYHKKGDKLALGDAELKEITYQFYKGRFLGVLINSAIGSNSAMVQTFRAQFGPGKKPNQFMDHYIWDGSAALVYLSCSDVTEKCSALLESQPLRQQQAADKAEAATKAKKDF